MKVWYMNGAGNDFMVMDARGGVYDFEAMAKDYDVIKLTDEGQWKTRLTNPSLYGWDCECILIMNPDVVTNVVPFKK